MGNILNFIRIRICISVTLIALLGYIIFNPLTTLILFVITSSFFLCASGYSYNNITDKKEDLINRGRINPYVNRKVGGCIVVFCFSIGLLSSYFLSSLSFIFAALFSVLIVAYSFFRLKRYFLLKNVYTSMLIAIPFIIGANMPFINMELVHHYLLVSLFIATGSMISDLRDYEGDRKNNIRTIPVVMGYENAKKLILMIIPVSMVLLLTSRSLFTLLPFAFLILILVYKNKHHTAHSLGSFSFIFALLYLLLI